MSQRSYNDDDLQKDVLSYLTSSKSYGVFMEDGITSERDYLANLWRNLELWNTLTTKVGVDIQLKWKEEIFTFLESRDGLNQLKVINNVPLKK